MTSRRSGVAGSWSSIIMNASAPPYSRAHFCVWHSGVASAGALAVALLASRGANAQSAPPADDLPLDVRADEVSFDVRSRALEAQGHVRVEEPPFYVTSDAIRIRRSNLGAELEGGGRLGFCPCLGTPVAVAFHDATIAPPYDVILRNPRLEIFGVPVAWAPVFWLRAPARPGVLPPDVALRGADGLFVGEGVHLPLRSDDDTAALDLHGGWYVLGGAAVDAHLYTDGSTTRILWDRFRGDDGVTVDARGSTNGAQPSPSAVAWDVDFIRGARGVYATTDVDAAAKPYDRSAAEAAWRDGGWTFASGVRSTAPRGGDVLDLGAVGPLAMARRAGALGGVGAYDVTIDGGELSAPALVRLAFARAEGGALVATQLGPFGASLAARGAADVASNGVTDGVDAVGSARATLSLPLVRGFASSDVNDPWVHRLEPRIDAAVLALRNDGVLGAAFARGAEGIAPGGAWTASAGGTSAVGRWGSSSVAELDASAGAVGDQATTGFAVRERATVATHWIGISGEGGHVLGGSAAGTAFTARARLGAVDGVNAIGIVAARDGVDPIRARLLTDAPLEPSSGFLTAAAWTGGARVAIPWTRSIVTRGGADADLTTSRLVAATASIEVRDPCGCLVVRATGAHRIGREGVDVWLTVDLQQRARSR